MAKGGRQPGAGRPPGSKNKLPRNIKERVVHVWDQLETEGKSLLEEARNDPPWFYVNFLKPMLPKEVQVDARVSVLDQLAPEELEALETALAAIEGDSTS